MNGHLRPQQYLMLLVTLGLALHWLSCGAFADVPSNAVLIAAMPPGTESVMVTRAKTSDSEGSTSQDKNDRTPPTRSTNKNIKTVVRSAVDQASVLAFAWGASDFQMPPTTGMTGNYNERAVYVVEQTVRHLREQLEAGRDVEGLNEHFDVVGVTVYKGTIDDKSIWATTHNSAGEAWFVALPDDHTIVSAESRSDIEYMLKSLRDQRSVVPSWWREIADGHNVESPLIILRRYPTPDQKRGRDPNLFLPPADAGITQFALTLLPDASSVTKISLRATNVDKAIDWYNRMILSGSEYVWNVKRTDVGAKGTLGPKRSGETPTTFQLSLILLFGPCVMI